MSSFSMSQIVGFYARNCAFASGFSRLQNICFFQTNFFMQRDRRSTVWCFFLDAIRSFAKLTSHPRGCADLFGVGLWIGVEGALALSEALTENNTVTELDLSRVLSGVCNHTRRGWPPAHTRHQCSRELTKSNTDAATGLILGRMSTIQQLG